MRTIVECYNESSLKGNVRLWQPFQQLESYDLIEMKAPVPSELQIWL